jgi:pimeloyl-ACP methyl ester carboxylesterase
MVSDPIDAEGTTFDERFVEVDDGVSLRVLRWRPREETDLDPLVFVPGWVSVIDGWRDLLRAIAGSREVVYVETREKRSARIARRFLRPDDFSIARIAADLITATDALGLADGRATFMGSSLGSTAVLEALKAGQLRARAAFLIGPNAEFRFPTWGVPVLYSPAAAYHGLKYVVLWYLRTFRVDVEKEPEQMARYERTVRAAHPQRIKLSARSVRGYKVWPGLESVEVPVGVAYAPSDSLHDAGEIRRLVRVLPGGQAVECPTNLYMHSAAVVEDLLGFEQGAGASS